MLSAFGVDHGEVYKGYQDQPRDDRGRWAAAHAQGRRDVKQEGLLSDEDLDQQYESYHVDYKSLWHLAEKNPQQFRKLRQELMEEAHYWHGRKEFDLSDDILTAVETGDEIRAKQKKAKRKPSTKKPVAKAFVKLRPKLARGLEDEGVKAHLTMNQKMRRHAVQARMGAGGQGQSVLRRMPAERREAMLSGPHSTKYGKPGTRHEVLRQQKVGAQGIYDTLGRQGRAKKVLP